MREIVHLQVGQCGNQIGSKVCALIILHNTSSFFTRFLSKNVHKWRDITANYKLQLYKKDFLVLFRWSHFKSKIKLCAWRSLTYAASTTSIFLLHLKNCARCAIERVFVRKNFNFGIDLRNFIFSLFLLNFAFAFLRSHFAKR